MRTPRRCRASECTRQVRRAEGVRITGISGVSCVTRQKERREEILLCFLYCTYGPQSYLRHMKSVTHHHEAAEHAENKPLTALLGSAPFTHPDGLLWLVNINLITRGPWSYEVTIPTTEPPYHLPKSTFGDSQWNISAWHLNLWQWKLLAFFSPHIIYTLKLSMFSCWTTWRCLLSSSVETIPLHHIIIWWLFGVFSKRFYDIK